MLLILTKEIFGSDGGNTLKTSDISPTRLPVRKQGLGTQGWGLLSLELKLPEVVKKLLGSRAAGLDEICPGFLKIL